MKRVEITEKKRIFSDFFKIEEARVSYERFDGEMSPPLRLLCFERGDSVAAVIYRRDIGKCILVNQFRYPTYAKGPGWILECVAGMLSPGEAPDKAVRREITEESGYNVDLLEPIATFYVSPGGSSERILLYYAEVSGLPQGGGGLASEGEDIAMLEASPRELRQLIREGAVQDAKTLIGIQWLLERHGT